MEFVNDQYSRKNKAFHILNKKILETRVFKTQVALLKQTRTQTRESLQYFERLVLESESLTPQRFGLRLESSKNLGIPISGYNIKIGKKISF